MRVLCCRGHASWGGPSSFLARVSPAKRSALLAFADRMLRPGGLLYVSYDALPGWAAVEPLRRLMLDGSADSTHLLEER